MNGSVTRLALGWSRDGPLSPGSAAPPSVAGRWRCGVSKSAGLCGVVALPTSQRLCKRQASLSHQPTNACTTVQGHLTEPP